MKPNEESFEHVNLLDADAPAEPSRQEPSPAAAAAGSGAGSPAAAEAVAPPAAPAASSPPAAAPAAAASPPPATQALNSVLTFFGASAAPTASADGGAAGQGAAGAAAAGGQGAAGGAAGEGDGDEPSSSEPDAIEEFEHEVMEAAEKIGHAAEEVGQKLLHGATEAKEAVASLAQGFTSWWSKLDPSSEAAGGEGSGSARGASGSSRQRTVDPAAAAEALGLEAGETVLESFACSLLQTYTSTGNFFTPPRQVAFPGSLHVTSQRLCFTFEERGLAPIKLAGKALKTVAKQPADDKQGLPERLEVQLTAQGQSVVLADFSLKELELDSALALLEHLAEE